MASSPSALSVLERVADLERADDLARLLRTVGLTAADEARSRLHDGLQELLDESGLSRDDGAIDGGNLFEALEHPTDADGEVRRQLSALLARGIALEPPADDDAAGRLARQLAWLSAHTSMDALWAIDDALGPQAEKIHAGLGRLVAAADAGELDWKQRPAALAAATALASSDSSAARSARAGLLETLGDTAFRRALGLAPSAVQSQGDEAPPPRTGASAKAEGRLRGERVAPPLGAVALVIWAVTGLLLIRVLLRWLARLVLRLRRPAELLVRSDGLTLKSTTLLLGKTVREVEITVPQEGLARAVREIRYPKLPLYAGLLALCAGSYLGISLFVDGARAGSPSLLGMGVGLVAAGVAIDLVLSVLLPGRQGKVRVVVVPRKGRSFAVLTADADAARAALRYLAGGR